MLIHFFFFFFVLPRENNCKSSTKGKLISCVNYVGHIDVFKKDHKSLKISKFVIVLET